MLKVKNVAKKIKSKQLKNNLLKLWQSIARNNSPREWSKAHRTPILAMVPQSEQEVAKKVFNVVMTNTQEEKDVQFAIDYLEKRPDYFSTLNDNRQIEDAFRKAIIDEDYRVLLDDNNEVCDELERQFPGDAYQWYPNLRAKEIIKKFAENKYFSGGACDKVTMRVMRMSNEEAKKLLIELLDKNYEVGLKLLRES